MIPEHLHPYIERGRIAQAEAIHDFMERLRRWLRSRRGARADTPATALDPAAALEQIKASAAAGKPIGQEIAERIVPDERSTTPG